MMKGGKTPAWITAPVRMPDGTQAMMWDGSDAAYRTINRWLTAPGVSVARELPVFGQSDSCLTIVNCRSNRRPLLYVNTTATIIRCGSEIMALRHDERYLAFADELRRMLLAPNPFLSADAGRRAFR